MQHASLANPSGFTHRLIVSFLINAGTLAAFVLTLLSVGGANISAMEAPVYFGSAIVVMLSGELLLRFAGLEALPARALVAIVIGATATSMVVLAGVLVTGFRAGPVFLGWAAIVAAALVVTHRRVSWRGRSEDLFNCMVVATLAVLVVFWCRHAAAAFPTLKATGVLPVWVDYYIHGATIAQFGSAFAAGRGAIDVAGQAIPLYHYGGFMLAAIAEAVADLPSLGLASAIFLPVGLLIAALGSYALATAVAGPLAGALAVAFFALLPDASHYGLANGFFGFHWLLFTAPGSGYALGAVAVALSLTNEWLRDRNLVALILAAALVAAVFQLRALFLPVLLPAFVALLVCNTTIVRRHATVLAWFAFGGCVLSLVLLFALPALRTFWLEHSVVIRFLEITHEYSHPTAYDGTYLRSVAGLGRVTTIVVGMMLLVPVVLGAFVLLYPACLIIWIYRKGWEVLDFFPLLLLLSYFAVVLLAPAAPNGNDNEFQHRPFVMVYQVAAIWTAAYLCRIAFGAIKYDPRIFAGPALMLVAMFSILTGWWTGHEPARPKPDWGKHYFGASIAPGIVEASAFVRRAAKPGDIVAVLPVDPKASVVDNAIEMVALTDAGSFLARPGILMIYEQRRNVAVERISRLGKIEASIDLASAMSDLRRAGVAWYVQVGADGPKFDPAKNNAAFATNNVAVYRVEPGKTLR